MNASLRVLIGDSVEDTIEVSQGKFLIGREVDCQLRYDSPFLSRHHCVLLLDEFTLRIRDLGSKNGTFVNGHRIGGGEGAGETILMDGDSVRIGEIILEIVLDCSVRGVHSASETAAAPSALSAHWGSEATPERWELAPSGARS
jgi:pSer/pThr/pTyr-binding forkhead associated (FHA) protein